MLVWRQADSWTAFTDGHRTWANGPEGLQVRLNTEPFAWETTPQPTATPAPSAPSASAPSAAAQLWQVPGWEHIWYVDLAAGQKHWLADASLLEEARFRGLAVEHVSLDRLNAVPTGPALVVLPLLRDRHSGAIYVRLADGSRRWVPDLDSLRYHGLHYLTWDEAVPGQVGDRPSGRILWLSDYPLGRPLPSADGRYPATSAPPPPVPPAASAPPTPTPVPQTIAPRPRVREIIFVPGLGTSMKGRRYADDYFGAIKRALRSAAGQDASFLYWTRGFSYSGGRDYGCKRTGQPLNESVRRLTEQILAIRADDPHARVTLIGHSYGGLLSYFQLRAVADGTIPTGTIENIITLDAPLHGSGRVRGFVAGIFTALFSSACATQATSSAAAQTLHAIRDQRGAWQREWERLAGVGRAHGIEVFTIGNAQDCVYVPSQCATSFWGLLFSGLVCAATGGTLGCSPLLGTFLATTENNANTQVVRSDDSRWWLGNFGTGDGTIVDSHAVVRRHPAVLDAIVRTVVG